MNTDTITIAHYPGLQDILWDIHADTITGREALYFYETRWSYLEEAQLTTADRQLIDALVKCYGNGVFMAA